MSAIVKIVNALAVVGMLANAVLGNWPAFCWAFNTLLWCSYAGKLEAKLRSAS